MYRSCTYSRDLNYESLLLAHCFTLFISVSMLVCIVFARWPKMAAVFTFVCALSVAFLTSVYRSTPFFDSNSKDYVLAPFQLKPEPSFLHYSHVLSNISSITLVLAWSRPLDLCRSSRRQSGRGPACCLRCCYF